MRKRAVIAVLVLLAACPPALADTAGVIDPEAVAFTLLRGRIAEVRALPDGSVLIVRDRRGPNLKRLWPDGRLEALPWAGRVSGIDTTASGSVVVTRFSALVDRLDLSARTRMRLASFRSFDLPRDPDSGFDPDPFSPLFRLGDTPVAALVDGSVVIASGGFIWRIAADGATSASDTGIPNSAGVVRLEGGGYADLTDDGNVFRVAPDGSRRKVIGGEVIDVIGPSGDGGVLASPYGFYREGLRVLSPAGAVTSYPPGSSAVLGTGDGLAIGEFDWPEVTSLAAAADGSLLFADDGALRAVVPPESPRPRIAITQAAYHTFASGRLEYLAGVPGRLRMILRPAAAAGESRVVETDTAAGLGTMTFEPEPAGRYPVRLQLTTPGATVEARTTIDTRATLPRADAAAALERRIGVHEEQDLIGGTERGECRRRAARVVACIVRKVFGRNHFFNGIGKYYRLSYPAWWADGLLRPDGRIIFRRRSLTHRVAPPHLGLYRPRLVLAGRTGVRARLRARSGPWAKASVSATVGGFDAVATAAATTVQAPMRIRQRLRPGTDWRPLLPIPSRRLDAVRHSKRVKVLVTVELKRPTPYGSAVTQRIRLFTVNPR